MMLENKNNIYQCLIDFQDKMIGVRIPENGYNPHFKSKYPTLKDIIETIRVPLIKCGLGYTQSITEKGVETIIFNVTGETITSLVPLNMAVTPQAMGSAITYARRYGITSALALVTEKDDDANIATSLIPEKKELTVELVNQLISQITTVEKANKAKAWFEKLSPADKLVANKTKLFVKIDEQLNKVPNEDFNQEKN